MRTIRKNKVGYGMIAPVLLVILVMQVYPLLRGILYAFTNYSLLNIDSYKFNFLDNFVRLFTRNDAFKNTIGFTLFYSVCVCVMTYLLGLAAALLLNLPLKGRGIFRALFLTPWIVSSTVTSMSWRWLLNDRFGFVNLFLQAIGLIDSPVTFFADPGWAKFTVIMINVWKSMPFTMIVLLSGLQSISRDLYEAAEMDGANWWDSFFHITMPSLKGISTMVTTLTFISTFSNFDLVYQLTGGGPNGATSVLATEIYLTAMKEGKIGYGSSMAVVVMIIMVFFALLRMRSTNDDNG